MTLNEKYEIIQQVSKLPTDEQLAFIECLIRELRKAFTDYAARARDLDDLVADMDRERALSNEDLEKPNVAG